MASYANASKPPGPKSMCQFWLTVSHNAALSFPHLIAGNPQHGFCKSTARITQHHSIEHGFCKITA